jgi:hypothetical protein
MLEALLLVVVLLLSPEEGWSGRKLLDPSTYNAQSFFGITILKVLNVRMVPEGSRRLSLPDFTTIGT